MSKSSAIDNISELQNAISGTANKVDITVAGKVYDELLEAADELNDFTASNKESQEIVREVIVKAIALLLRSRGKEIVLRDRKNNLSETYTLWKTR